MNHSRFTFPGRTVPARYALLALIALCGCKSFNVGDPIRTGPFYQPSNYTGEAQLPVTMRRVVLLPLSGGKIAPPDTVAALGPVFIAALQKTNRFEVVPLTREQCLARFRVEELPSTAALPADLGTLLQREFAADGVVLVDITVYQPYRPLAIGVRAKLVMLGPDTRLMWAFDEVFSTSNPAVANSARRHLQGNDRRGVPADFTQAVLQSPSRFAGYVASETFATLPRVYQPPLTVR